MEPEIEADISSDYEKAIGLVGYGLFHYWLLFICGLGNANEAIAIISVSFLLPAAECELKLTTVEKGWLNVVMFVGLMTGGYFGGSVCDLFGRRRILIFCLILDGCFTLLVSLAKTYETLLANIFLVGLGVGSSVPILWAYFTEFQPKTKRGTALCYLSSFWMIGNLVVTIRVVSFYILKAVIIRSLCGKKLPEEIQYYSFWEARLKTVSVLGWLVIPDSNYNPKENKSAHLHGWRLFIALCSIPSFLVAFGLIYLPNSPKFLMLEGKYKEAKSVLEKIYAINHGRGKKPLAITFNEDFEPQMKVKKKIVYAVIMMMRNTGRLLHFPFRNVLCAVVLVVFSLCFGYYGLWMWLPEMFKRMEHSLSANVGICDVEVPISKIESSQEDCSHTMEGEIFRDEIIVAMFNFPGHLLAILFMDKVGRRIFLMSGMMLSGFIVFNIWLVTSKWSCLLLAALFGMLSTLSHSALGVLGMEVFPTDLRGTACGVSQIAARLGAILGNVVFGQLVDNRCSVPILMVAAFLTLGGLFSRVMPDLTRMPLL